MYLQEFKLGEPYTEDGRSISIATPPGESEKRNSSPLTLCAGVTGLFIAIGSLAPNAKGAVSPSSSSSLGVFSLVVSSGRTSSG